jgi:hypothetical protein
VEAPAVVAAYRLPLGDPSAEVLTAYPDAAVDEAKAQHWAGNWAREWGRRFDRTEVRT